MNVSLTPELEKFVADKVASGWFKNASEVVRQSLREMKEQDDKCMEKVREDIEIGWQQARAGLGVDGPTYMRKVRQPTAEGEKGDGQEAEGPLNVVTS